jgi:hypothetical protein
MGFAVEEVQVRARAGRSGARHVIWLASVKPAGARTTRRGTA